MSANVSTTAHEDRVAAIQVRFRAELDEESKNMRQEEIKMAERRIAELTTVRTAIVDKVTSARALLEEASCMIREHARSDQ